MQGTHLRPQRRLGFSEESADLGREEGALDIPFGSGGALPAAWAEKRGLDVGFKGLFVGLGVHGRGPLARVGKSFASLTVHTPHA